MKGTLSKGSKVYRIIPSMTLNIIAIFLNIIIMIFTETHILSDKELKRLKDHQYSSSCCSLLDPLMQKYWNW